MSYFWQVIAHVLGDYVFQSDWMAQTKTKQHLPAAAHALVYTLIFALFGASIPALLVIGGSHFLIDRYRLARYVCWAKNFLAPRATTEVEYTTAFVGPGGREFYDEKIHVTRWWYPWSECTGTGYHKDRPIWLSVWLLIITDNVLHLIINALALRYL